MNFYLIGLFNRLLRKRKHWLGSCGFVFKCMFTNNFWMTTSTLFRIILSSVFSFEMSYLIIWCNQLYFLSLSPQANGCVVDQWWSSCAPPGRPKSLCPHGQTENIFPQTGQCWRCLRPGGKCSPTLLSRFWHCQISFSQLRTHQSKNISYIS